MLFSLLLFFFLVKHYEHKILPCNYFVLAIMYEFCNFFLQSCSKKTNLLQMHFKHPPNFPLFPITVYKLHMNFNMCIRVSLQMYVCVFYFEMIYKLHFLCAYIRMGTTRQISNLQHFIIIFSLLFACFLAGVVFYCYHCGTYMNMLLLLQ